MILSRKLRRDQNELFDENEQKQLFGGVLSLSFSKKFVKLSENTCDGVRYAFDKIAGP